MRILVADASASVLRRCRNALEKGGHQVLGAASGSRALQILGRRSVDLIVADPEMAVGNGFNLLKVCKDDFAFRRIPFIAISTAAPNTEGDGLLATAAADAYVLKPVKSRELAKAVKSASAHSARPTKGRKAAPRRPAKAGTLAKKAPTEDAGRLFKVLFLCNQAVVRAKEEGKLLQDVCDILTATGGYRAVWAGYAHADKAAGIRPVAHSGFDAEGPDEPATFQPGDDENDRAQRALADGCPVIEKDAGSDVIALPLKSGEEVFGVLSLRAPKKGRLKDEVALLEQLASDLAYGISTLRERRQHEEATAALSESEQRFRKAVESTSDLVWEWDTRTGKVDIYGDAAGFLGRKRRSLSISIDEWSGSLHPDDRDRVMAALKRHADTGKPLNIEYRTRLPDGAIHYWITRSLALRDQDGQTTRSVGACVDISERRLLDKRMQVQREMATALEAAQDVDEVARICLDGAVRIADMDAGAVYLYDQATGRFALSHQYGFTSEAVERLSAAAAGPDAALLFGSVEPAYSPVGELKAPLSDVLMDQGFAFSAIVPALREGNAVAQLVLCSRTSKQLPEFHRASLESLAADIVGTAIQHVGAKQALRASEERYRLIAENALDVIWVMDKDLGYIYVSPSIELQRGYTVDQFTAMSVEQAVATSSVEPVFNAVLAAIADLENTRESSHSFTIEMEVNCVDGSTLWTETSFTVLADSHGKFNGVLGVSRDITERRRFEKALGESEDRFRRLFDQSSIGSATVSIENHHFVAANRSLCDFLGYSEAELRGLTPADITHPDYRAADQEQGRRLDKGEIDRYSRDKLYLRKDGTPVWGHLSLTIIRDAGRQPLYHLSLIEDITGRKKAEAELSLRAQLLDLATDAIIMRDPAGNILYVNEAAATYTGYSSEELTRMSVADLAVPEYASRLEENTRRVLQEGAIEIESVHRRKDGSLVNVEIHSRPVDYNGAECIISSIRDITERKRAEEELNLRARLLDLATDAILVHDAAGNFLYANEAAAAMLGYTMAEFMSLNLNDIDVPIADSVSVAERVEQSKARGPLSFESAHRRKDGSMINVEVRSQPIEYDGKNYLLSIGRDITQRKKDERDLKTADEELSLRARLLDLATDAIIVHDAQGNVLYANEAASSRVGFTKDEFLATNLNEHRVVPDNVPVEQRCEQIQSGRGVVFESANRRKDGAVINTEVHIDPVEYAGKTCYLSVSRDITQRKKDEQELNLRAHLLDTSTDAIFMHYGDGNFAYVNEALCRNLGYSRDELLGINLRDLIVSADPNRFDNNTRKIKELGAMVFESVYRRQDGTSFEVEVHARTVDFGGRQCIFSAIRDISQRKRAQEELQDALSTVSSTLEGTIEAVATMSELRDPYTAGHQRMVSKLAVAIAQEMGLAEDRVHGLRVAGLLHDVGKVNVPSEILSKPGRLSELEMSLARAHAEAGYDIVRAIRFPWPVDDMVRQHHERMNGSGYPHGLSGDQIILEARILAVADVVEAMVSHRPYRAALGIDKALSEIEQNRGTLYDERVVDACLLLFREKDFRLE